MAAEGSNPDPALKRRDRLERAKDCFSIIQSVATTLAFAAGAWWFFHQKLNSPRIVIENRVEHRTYDGRTYYLLVNVTVSNVGSVEVDGCKVAAPTIQVVDFVPGGQVLANDRLPCSSVKPGERQDIPWRHFLVTNSTTVLIDTFFPNPNNSHVGWRQDSLHDLRPQKATTPGEHQSQ